MVISDSNNFIYIRVPKNASTSLATFFVKNYCNTNDKWTAVGDSGLKTNNVSPEVVAKHRKQYRFIHLTLNEIIQEGIVTEADARSKRVIGVIRNPLERQLSLYFFLNRQSAGTATVSQFRSIMQKGFYESDGSNHILQTDYLKIGDESVGEFWKYENLNEHLEKFVQEQKYKPAYPLNSYKANFKPKNIDLINEYYDAATRKAVEEYFAKDFEAYEN
jgi:hypothetical protein